MEQKNNIESQCALQLAFQTMKERCQQLQARLSIVEEENIYLHQHYKKNNSMTILRVNGEDQHIIQNQQEKIEELRKQKLQLVHHIFMVSSENRQLWKRLTRLTRTNKSSGNQLTKISDTLKQYPTSEIPAALTYSFKEIPEIFRNSIIDQSNFPDNEEKEHSLEEISLRLINSIMIEKSELEKQYADIVELQSNTEMNFKNIGFTYPEDLHTDSLEHLKYHDTKLTELKEELMIQQNKLKNALQNLKKKKKNETCNNCKNSITKLMCQTGTQFDLHCSLKENDATQTSFPIISLTPDRKIQTTEDENICPLCGTIYKKSVSFELFHEHVISHFTSETTDGFEMLT
ncbi:PREDICTED: uncharacterized protein LOC105368263 [Ceratosolen solmsi marchali]|uniref:Uncharacterized protein LOC105368263 n=1 Tax=Ceratosolen solmsi marchali TaxID=326594 RepID=A0AAJ6YW81_9HYME|nr:PREDICTED: uncharacterized protein LOC105368263 [Ceratosolen solmsi marchali]